MKVSYATLVTNMPIEPPTQITMGSLTTNGVQPPQGQVMKLDMPNLSEDEPGRRRRIPLRPCRYAHQRRNCRGEGLDEKVLIDGRRDIHNQGALDVRGSR